MTDSGGDRRIALMATISETMPAGMQLEMQVSADLGATDPWHVVASKSGSSAWVGLPVTSTPASEGKVTYTISPLLSPLQATQQYFRLSLSSY